MLPDAFGCAVANRYLLDDDADPFDLMSQVETVKEKKKKKKKEEEDKKKQKKPGHKESQKDRRQPLASDGQDPAPGELNNTHPSLPSFGFLFVFSHTTSSKLFWQLRGFMDLDGAAKSGECARALSAADGAGSARLVSTCASCQGGEEGWWCIWSQMTFC